MVIHGDAPKEPNTGLAGATLDLPFPRRRDSGFQWPQPTRLHHPTNLVAWTLYPGESWGGDYTAHGLRKNPTLTYLMQTDLTVKLTVFDRLISWLFILPSSTPVRYISRPLCPSLTLNTRSMTPSFQTSGESRRFPLRPRWSLSRPPPPPRP